MVVSAWVLCGHCDELLTRLVPSQQNYCMDLQSELCKLQLGKSRKPREGLGSPEQGGVKSEPGNSPAKIGDIGEEEWRSALACILVEDLVTVSTAQEEPDNVPEMPAASVCSADPT